MENQPELPIAGEQSTLASSPSPPAESPGGLIHKALVAIMRAVGPIAKDQRNTQQSYSYRGIEQVYNACHPIFAENGVYSASTVLDHKFETRQEKDKQGKPRTVTHSVARMRFTFYAEDGSNVSTEVIGEGIDYNGDKASNKAMSAADKYALLQLLKIPTAAVDSDRTPAPNPAADPAAPMADPRGKRESVSVEMIKHLVAEWKSKNEGATPDDWKTWVCQQTMRDFNVHNVAFWTMQDYQQCRGALGLTEDDEVPF